MAGLCRCAPAAEGRLQTARQVATGARLQEQDIAAAPFVLRAYQRFGSPGDSVVRVYIEGDGLAWLDRETPSPDPTPRHPMGLRLAAADPGANVIYLARPCQYNMTLANGAACPQRYWTNAVFAPEVIAAYQQALGQLKTRHGFSQIELVGYSGGGGIAALIAASRGDISSLRTVAGNLDTATFSRVHGVSPMSGSANPVDVAASLAGLPQLHFVGGEDKIVPVDLFEDFRGASRNSSCVRSEIIPGMKHDGDWPGAWPGLLAHTPHC